MKNQVQLITYVDRLSGGGLGDLHELLQTKLAGLFGGVHLLPFFYPIDGSDAGFDPIDHTQVDPRLGGWEQARRLGEECHELEVRVAAARGARPVAWRPWVSAGDCWGLRVSPYGFLVKYLAVTHCWGSAWCTRPSRRPSWLRPAQMTPRQAAPPARPPRAVRAPPASALAAARCCPPAGSCRHHWQGPPPPTRARATCRRPSPRPHGSSPAPRAASACASKAASYTTPGQPPSTLPLRPPWAAGSPARAPASVPAPRWCWTMARPAVGSPPSPSTSTSSTAMLTAWQLRGGTLGGRATLQPMRWARTAALPRRLLPRPRGLRLLLVALGRRASWMPWTWMRCCPSWWRSQ